MSHTLIFGHRGASGLVPFENTIDAFRKAKEVGADGIETDIRKTKDNVIIINHNPDIDGLVIKDHTYEELANKTKEIGYELTTFEAGLKFCKEEHIFMDIEFKEPGYEKQALDLIFKYFKIGEFYCRSFNFECLQNIHKLAPEIFTILLVGIENATFNQRFHEIFPRKYMKDTFTKGISPYYKEMILGYNTRMKLKKTYLSLWTVNDEEDMRKFIKQGVDCIVTNYPDKALAIRKEIEESK